MQPVRRLLRRKSLFQLGLALTLTTGALVVAFVQTKTAVTPVQQQENLFTSKRYGYSLALPHTWLMHETPGEWQPGAQPTPGESGVDGFVEQTSGRILVVAARPGSAGITLEAWSEDAAALTPQQCHTDVSLPAKVGGESAQLWEIRCPDGAFVTKLAALHEGRGYVFVLVSETKSDSADREFFANVMRSFKFAS